MPDIPLTLPTPGGSTDTWGATLNAALTQLNQYDRPARKTADEPITNSTLQNDDDLVVPVLANGIYLVEWGLRTDGPTAADFKYAFTGPAGATMVWESQGLAAGDTTNVAPAITDVAAIGTTVTHGTLGAGVVSRIRGRGLLVVAGTAGNLQLQWAQGTTNATPSKNLAGSWLNARRVA